MRSLLSIFFLMTILSVFGQHATINSHETEIIIKDVKTLLIREKKSVTIHKEEGYYLGVYQGYDDEFSRITKISVSVLDQNGKRVKKLGRSHSQNWNFNENYEIDDLEIVILDPEYQQYPFTVEIFSEVRMSKGFLNLPTWMPRPGLNVEVTNTSLKVQKPIDFELNTLFENIDDPQIVTDGENEIWTWGMTDLESVENDVSYTQFYREQPKVLLGPSEFIYGKYPGSFASWSSFGDWYMDLNSNEYELGSETIEFLSGVSDLDSKEVVREIYTYMQRRTRYISIQLGIGGYQSLPAEFVDSKGYGDCKALSTYMKSMLDFKGIESNYILVQAGRNARDIKPEIISNQFNHVFLGVPMEDDTLYLECTSQEMPSGFTGSFTDDRNVLWVDRGGSSMIRMPSLNAETNKIVSNSVVKLDKHGNSVIGLKQKRSGMFYEDITFFKSVNEKQREEYLYNQFEFKDFIIDDFSYKDVSGSPNYHCSYDITVNNLARSASDKLLLPVGIYPLPNKFFTYNKYSKFSEIKRAFSIDETITIELPKDLYSARIPQIEPFDTPYGSYECQIKDLTDGTIEIKRRIKLEKGIFMDEDFTQFNSFFESIKKADRTKLIFVSGT